MNARVRYIEGDFTETERTTWEALFEKYLKPAAQRGQFTLSLEYSVVRGFFEENEATLHNATLFKYAKEKGCTCKTVPARIGPATFEFGWA